LLRSKTVKADVHPIKPTHLAVVALWAEDVPATAHFYRDVLGLDLMPHHGHRPAFDLGHGAHLVILRGEPVPAVDPELPLFPQVAFAVEDLDRAVGRLEAHGVELLSGLQRGPDARWVVFRDPAGNLIELAQFNDSIHRPVA
jgi:catechol 2,3-dioxygenase-like lactoylglutathione lyase family enzyme